MAREDTQMKWIVRGGVEIMHLKQEWRLVNSERGPFIFLLERHKTTIVTDV